MPPTPATRIPGTGREAVFDWVDQHHVPRRSPGLTRTIRSDSTDAATVDLAGSDYLDLSRHPAVVRGATEATERWGTGSASYRLVSGTTEVHQELEEELAARYGVESALLFSSGYAANLAAVTGLSGPETLILSDQHNHASLIDGCRLSRGRTRVTPHADVWAIDGMLRMHRGGALVVTESVFAVDGDLAPLRELHEVCGEHGAGLLVHDARGLGVLGQAGSGAFNEAGLDHPPDVVATAAMSKAMGTQGGVVLGPRRVIRHLAHNARTFLFDAGPAPSAAGAALAGLRVLSAEPGRVERVRWVANRLHKGLTSVGLTVNPPGAAILTLPTACSRTIVDWATACRDHGVIVGCLQPPLVPESSSRLRLNAHVDLTDTQIEKAVHVIAKTAPKHLRIPARPQQDPDTPGI